MITGHCHCGAVHWQIDARPAEATACNCTVCRRYGTLWAYGYDGADIHASGETSVYIRGDRDIGFHFCANCGCVAYWRGLVADPALGFRIAVNLRLAAPGDVATIPVRHFDGRDSFKSLGTDGRCVADMWF